MPNGKLCGNGYTFVDTRDEKQEEYATVQIGEQCWMAENLRYTGNGCESNSWTSSTYNACDTIIQIGVRKYYISGKQQ
ncbi:MAG: hypothetical protein PHY26_04885 [Bacilli bacterium]|nr:hypothetical protein [Bacilli bacterium]